MGRCHIFTTDIRELRDDGMYEKALSLIDSGRLERVQRVKHEGSRLQMVAAGVLTQYAMKEYSKHGLSVGINTACVTADTSSVLSGSISDGCGRQVRLSEMTEELCRSKAESDDACSENPKDADIIKICNEGRRDTGQPYLPDYPDIYISLSHSGEYAMCGIADAPIGVDIQEHGEAREVMDIAERFFHEEEAAYLKGIADKQQVRAEFYRLWCLHEAYVKNTGRGLSESFKEVSFLDVLKAGKVCDGKTISIIDAPAGYSAAAVIG